MFVIGDILAHSVGKAWAELHLSRLADAEATVSRAIERRMEETTFSLVPYFIAFLKGDGEDITRKAALAKGKRFTEDMIFTPGGARSGSLRPIAGRETDVGGRRRRRKEFRSARASGVV